MTEAGSCENVSKNKALTGEKNATEAIQYGYKESTKSSFEVKTRSRFGRGFKGYSKSLIPLRCCYPISRDADESSEDENGTVSTLMLPPSFYQKSIGDLAGEEEKANFMQDGFSQYVIADRDRKNCRCKYASLECDILNMDQSHNGPLDQRLHKRQGNCLYSQYDLILHEPRSRSQSRATYASSRNNTLSRSSSISEWHIPFDDITLDEMIARSCRGPVYKGKWHGDVMVHKITKIKKEDFLKEIALLNLIRHENIILFMGASIEGPDLAIITSPVKGYSLYTHIHEKITVFSARSKIDIASQIAQGMEYLHAKKIELGQLCSRNVFLESKVKIGMTDWIYKHIPTAKSSYGYIPDRQILCYSPEMLKGLRVKDGILCSDKPASFASDVFAFGTILYEIFLEEYPYATEHLEIVIWNISSGRNLHTFDNIPTAAGQGLVEVCWKFEAAKRPSFQEIIESLRRQDKPRLNRQYSISQPSVISLTHMNLPMRASDDY